MMKTMDRVTNNHGMITYIHIYMTTTQKEWMRVTQKCFWSYILEGSEDKTNKSWKKLKKINQTSSYKKNSEIFRK